MNERLSNNAINTIETFYAPIRLSVRSRVHLPRYRLAGHTGCSYCYYLRALTRLYL